jgi:hypothetical protein
MEICQRQEDSGSSIISNTSLNGTVWPIHYFYIEFSLVSVTGKIISTFLSGKHFNKSEKIKN